MAGLGRKVFTATEVLTAANVNGYLMDQTVMVFASSTARSSALGTAASAGMVSFSTATEALELYTHGTWTGLNYSTIVNGTAAAYTATASDANTTYVASSTAAQSIVFTDVFDIGERLDIIRDGAGTVSISCSGTGITTWAGAGTASTSKVFAMGTQYSAASVLKVAANSYRVIGAVA